MIDVVLFVLVCLALLMASASWRRATLMSAAIADAITKIDAAISEQEKAIAAMGDLGAAANSLRGRMEIRPIPDGACDPHWLSLPHTTARS